MDIAFASADYLPEVGDFFARVIAGDSSYVSHGEVQTGLSSDGVHWDADLRAKFAEDMAELDDARSVVVARIDGTLAGAAIILWEVTSRVSFMVIEDLAVAPAMRSHGVGAALVEFAEREGIARGMQWAFLESGLNNDGAHRFFEKRGFRAMSKVFSKRL